MVPPLAEAVKSTVPVPHLEAPAEAVIVGCIFTVATTAVLAAELQLPSTAST